MNAAQASVPKTPSESQEISLRLEIDRSARVPVLFAFACAIFWLLAGSLLGLASAWKLTCPWLLDGIPWLTFGRLRPAHLCAVAYGWASLSGIGAGLWMTARLCRIPTIEPRLITVSICLWNLGLTTGLLGILTGGGNSREWLEMPGYASHILIAAFLLLAGWMLAMFFKRAPVAPYISEYYLLAALLWFPWIYATANMLLVWRPVPGPAQPAVHWWFVQNFYSLWIVPLGLAAAFYLIPKILGVPLHSKRLASLGFWSLAALAAWSTGQHMIGGPLPSWMAPAATAAGILSLVPVATVAANLHLTMRGHFDRLLTSPSLRFTVFGAVAYTATALPGTLLALPSFNAVAHFTDFTIGHSHLGMYAFFSMVMFGAIYFIAPRLTGGEWPSAPLIRWHFRLSASGIVLMVMALSLGGLLQGLALADPDAAFKTSVAFASPFRWIRGLAGFLLLAGHVLFAWHFVRMLVSPLRGQAIPTLLTGSDARDPAIP